MMISIVLDSAQGVLAGVSRGCGWQHLVAMTNLVMFYLVGMPLAILFTFKLKFYSKVRTRVKLRWCLDLLPTMSQHNLLVNNVAGQLFRSHIMQGLWAGLICGVHAKPARCW